MDQRIKKLRQKSKNLKPILKIGKRGLTKEVVEEINKVLKKKKLVKIKLLRSYLHGKDKKETAKNIANLVKSELIQQIGNVIVLYKK